MKNRFIFLFILLLIVNSILLSTGTFSFAAKIAVVKSSRIKPYQIALDAFAKTVGAEIAEYDMTGKVDRDSEIIREIAFKRPDLVLALGTKAAKLSYQNIRDIPIIFCMVSRPEKYELTGENITGVSLNIPAKVQFETLKSILPYIKRIGVVFNQEESGKAVKKADKEAKKLGLELVALQVESEKEVPRVTRDLKGNIDALWMIMDSTIVTNESVKHLILFTLRNKIPFMGLSIRFVQEGALLALSADYADMGRQASKLAKQILKGNSPKDLPIVPPEKTKLFLNLKAAKLIGIDFPPHVIQRADKIFE